MAPVTEMSIPNKNKYNRKLKWEKNGKKKRNTRKINNLEVENYINTILKFKDKSCGKKKRKNDLCKELRIHRFLLNSKYIPVF